MVPAMPLSQVVVNLVLGVFLSTVAALASLRARFLTADGAAAATVVGTLTLGFGGWGVAALVGLFFLTSSLLTRWRGGEKRPADPRGARAAAQVMANGGVPAILAVVWGLTRAGPLADASAASIAAAIAAATADTWATELGLLSRTPPRLITTGRPVPAGTSGGVTATGTLAAVVGAALVAGAGQWWLGAPFWVSALVGTGAMMLDSVLGATVERHRTGITNDVVNLLSTLAAASAGAILSIVL